ncbi:hypothetical protein ACYX79_03345 [Stenotrophomonas rhizophila]|uniref:ATP-binding protein n=1 Tax=Stenotrophomonas rhizophila TaxID=216778 RepID=A0A498CMU0_9GAMM|nr:hypothetical protein [Stenotrophomonas rhizophila]RLK56454.1 hypothetical protein BCL79_0843 [Stenotrophomonas rhizophila]
MLNFPENSLAFHLEAFLQNARTHQDQELTLPAQLYLDGGLGSAAQAVQVLSQLSIDTDQDLSIQVKDEALATEPSRRRLAETLHGMAALYFANSAALSDTVISRRDLRQTLVPRLLAMRSQNYKTLDQKKSASLCFLMGSKNEFLPSVYSASEPRTVRSRSEFLIAFRRMLNSLDPERDESFLTEGAENYLNTLVHELFLNADEHGSIDAYGNRLRQGMRGIHMQLTSMVSAPDVARDAGEDNALRFYLATLPLHGSFESEDNATLLEMSVFDTGPGMGLSWLSRISDAKTYDDFELEEELEAVKTCFKKQATTRSSVVRGQGLPTVLRALNRLNAFMTVRTGRTSLYQDFSLVDSDEFHPYQRFSNEELPLISGTSFTIWFRIK